MNERIQELKGQVLDKHFSHTWSTMDYDDIEKFADKFAEVIINECCVALSPMLRDMISRGQGVDAIKKHFGIVESKGWVCPKCGTDRTKQECPKGYTAALSNECPMIGTA